MNDEEKETEASAKASPEAVLEAPEFDPKGYVIKIKRDGIDYATNGQGVCPFCNGLYDAKEMSAIAPFRSPDWSPTIPHKTCACSKCMKALGMVATDGTVPAPIEEEEPADVAASPNPLAGATMGERINATLGGSLDDADENE